MQRSHVIAIAVFVLAVALLFIFNPRNAPKVQSGVLGAASPFLKAGSSLSTFREGLKSLEQLEQENALLRSENKELKAVNQSLRDLESENNKLREALGYRSRAAFQLIPARVVARDASTWWNTIKIDKGLDHGIEPDMPVITESGLVGKTTTVASDMSTVILISDESCKVSVTVAGTREQGIVKGERTSSNSQPIISMGFISKEAVLEKGQRVETSGVGGVYPKGLFVGVVDHFETRALDGYAILKPAVDLAEVEDVFVVADRK